MADPVANRAAQPPLVVVMGVAGAGKTTVGAALAQALGVPFVDGDALHPPANVAKMRAGQPLDERDRAPWLDAVHARLRDAAAAQRGLVVACSALRAGHRRRLAQGLPALRFVHLDVDRATLTARLAARREHFFPAALLDDQLAALEPPTGEPGAAVLDGVAAPGMVVAAALRALQTDHRRP